MKIYQVYLIDTEDVEINTLIDRVRFFLSGALRFFGISIIALGAFGLFNLLMQGHVIHQTDTTTDLLIQFKTITGYLIIGGSIVGLIAGSYMLWAAFVYFNKLPKEIRESKV